MFLGFFILFLLVILVILLFSVALRIKFVFDSNNTDISMTVLWLSPLIKAFIYLENTKPFMTIYLLNKRIFKKALTIKKGKTKGTDLIKLTNPKDIHVNAYYGFQDPFNTGIACGAINIASQFINIDSFIQNPDFISANDYIYMNANAKVNLGSTLINFLKARVNK